MAALLFPVCKGLDCVVNKRAQHGREVTIGPDQNIKMFSHDVVKLDLVGEMSSGYSLQGVGGDACVAASKCELEDNVKMIPFTRARLVVVVINHNNFQSVQRGVNQ